jgi:hypothetical protein
MPLPKNQNYKMRYRPNYWAQLGRYKELPPPMVGNPPVTGRDWNARCWAVYGHMMAIKNGVVPPTARRGLWFYDAH